MTSHHNFPVAAVVGNNKVIGRLFHVQVSMTADPTRIEIQFEKIRIPVNTNWPELVNIQFPIDPKLSTMILKNCKFVKRNIMLVITYINENYGEIRHGIPFHTAMCSDRNHDI